MARSSAMLCSRPADHPRRLLASLSAIRYALLKNYSLCRCQVQYTKLGRAHTYTRTRLLFVRCTVHRALWWPVFFMLPQTEIRSRSGVGHHLRAIPRQDKLYQRYESLVFRNQREHAHRRVPNRFAAWQHRSRAVGLHILEYHPWAGLLKPSTSNLTLTRGQVSSGDAARSCKAQGLFVVPV